MEFDIMSQNKTKNSPLHTMHKKGNTNNNLIAQNVNKRYINLEL